MCGRRRSTACSSPGSRSTRFVTPCSPVTCTTRASWSACWRLVRLVRPAGRRCVRRTRRGRSTRRTAIDLVALDVDDLAERVPDLHQVCRVGHHLVDVLVGGGDLVEEGGGVTELDAPHGLAQLSLREGTPGRT